MPCTIQYHADSHFVETMYSGALSPEEVYEGAAESIAVAYSRQCTRFLGDCVKLTNDYGMLEVKNLVAFLEATGVDRSVKEALLLPEAIDSAKYIALYATVCKEHGYRVRGFVTRDAALEWLLED